MSALIATRSTLPAGGGPFALDTLTTGVFLSAQPDHRVAVGADRGRHLPLAHHEVWMMPAGAEGLCLCDAPLDRVTVAVGPRC